MKITVSIFFGQLFNIKNILFYLNFQFFDKKINKIKLKILCNYIQNNYI